MRKAPTTRKHRTTEAGYRRSAKQTKQAGAAEGPTPPDQWEDRVRQIAEEVFTERLSALQTVPPSFPVEGALPLPHRTGRKENRRYRKISVTLDEVLAERLLDEAKKQRLSPGKILDQVLWERYGRPPLSYQTEDFDTP